MRRLDHPSYLSAVQYFLLSAMPVLYCSLSPPATLPYSKSRSSYWLRLRLLRCRCQHVHEGIAAKRFFPEYRVPDQMQRQTKPGSAAASYWAGQYLQSMSPASFSHSDGVYTTIHFSGPAVRTKPDFNCSRNRGREGQPALRVYPVLVFS